MEDRIEAATAAADVEVGASEGEGALAGAGPEEGEGGEASLMLTSRELGWITTT